MPLQATRAFHAPVVEAQLDLPDRLQERGPQGVVHRLCENIGPRRHQVHADVEWRARFQPALDHNAGLVDPEGLADCVQVLLDERGERSGGTVVDVFDGEFHDAPRFADNSAFDKDAFSHLQCGFMETSNAAPEWLNYHHLRYFHAVAREGSISRAAEKLRTSQPSICAQVKQLESALGEPLYRRSGRSIVLTDFGRLIHGYAEEIFALGRELLTIAKRAPSARTLRLHVGIVDSFPKLLSLDILRPVFAHDPPVRITCHEGKLEDLLGQLAAHRLDALLADEPPPSSTKVKTFCHSLGTSGVTFCASPALGKTLTRRFPRNLHGAPVLLPTQNTALRRELEKWFRTAGIEPVVVGEFEDAALSKIVATEGLGITVVPTVIESEAIERYGFVPLGRTDKCQIQLYLITAERRIEHPAVAVLAREAGRALIGRRRDRTRARESRRPPPGAARRKAAPPA